MGRNQESKKIHKIESIVEEVRSIKKDIRESIKKNIEVTGKKSFEKSKKKYKKNDSEKR